MFALELARQFRKTRSQQRFISFISMSSTVGIALGCFVLILLLSVMNGFEKELTNRILSVIPHGELYSVDKRGIDNVDAQRYRLEQDERIARVTPYTKLTGMLQYKGELKAIELTGIIAADNQQYFEERVSQPQWLSFQANDKGVLIGQGIAEKLGVQPGDAVQVLVPVATNDLTFKAPKTITLTVSGFLSIGGELDNLVGLMHLDMASNAAEITSKAQGMQFTFYNAYSANEIMREIGYSYPQAVYMSDWTRTQGHLYNDIQLVRAVVYIALVLVIGVACFNIVSSLVMAVREKQAAIAILKTMGATDSLIRTIFILQGIINGVVGITTGVLLALLVAPNLSAIVLFVENALGIEVLSGDIYFIDFLPSELHWGDVGITVALALTLCVLATLYPAQKAVKISPSSALH
ncbi:lipoprotein-releasing ABC transporter permease subunit [Alteromonas sp.]|uniref:lipoprotein-releasing ABC transporter permease subunit n=1 Tax=Alteromonas sp. TaxID=232 RepID=UPI000B692F5D|nr:lipoprotein-releasing ABC transporter permease subunit [Alteromonas sp.]MAI39427.1 lipoprotein-releasing system transmembrane subunit LolC [Alteromonas sp.]OUX83723.1 MAG: lipoprotein-releasing system transmembrane subunit LolC [Alteromonas sp. TMED35]|tara:strand:+ start:2712 stop:3938 length:1227 start_codon:yes stop_codon:yes gene_type:complete